MQFTTLALAALLGLTSAQTVHVVSVATSNNSLIYTPDNIKVPVGDMVQFQFRAGNHSVAQSNFDNPCTPISQHVANATGMFSGFMPVAASAAMGMVPTYTMMVSTTTPQWFYCATAKHCQAGMVMVINENTAANASRSLANFKTLAKAAPANIAPTSSTTNAGTSSGTSTGTGSTGSSSGTASGSGSSSGTASGSGSSTSTGATPAATAGASTIAMSSSAGLLGLFAAMLLL